MGAHHRTSCRKLFKKLQILTVSSQYTTCPLRTSTSAAAAAAAAAAVKDVATSYKYTQFKLQISICVFY